MESASSISISSPLCFKENSTQAHFSCYLRIGSIALGTITILTAILIFYKVPLISQWGITTAKVLVPIGVCALLVGSCLKCVKKYHPNQIIQGPKIAIQVETNHLPEIITERPPDTIQKPEEKTIKETNHVPDDISETKDVPTVEAETLPIVATKINEVPNEIWLETFSFLRIADLLNCAQVCKKWESVIKQTHLWKRLIAPGVFDDYFGLVQQNLCTWAEAYRYRRLSSFLSQLVKRKIFAQDAYCKKWNPQLASVDNACVRMPCFFAQYGHFQFFISDMINVTVRQSGELFSVLKGKADKELTHLAVEDEMLFAIDKTGIIYQWHYLSGELKQTIETAWAKNDPDFQNKVGHVEVSQHNGFQVNDGKIIISYGQNDRNTGHLCHEIIYYKSQNLSHIISDKRFNYIIKASVKGEKLYRLAQQSFFIWNLRTNREERAIEFDTPADPPSDFVLVGDKLYTVSRWGKVSIHNIQNGHLISEYRVPFSDAYFLTIEVIDRIVFGFTSYKSTHDAMKHQKDKIVVFHSGIQKAIATLSVVVNEETFEIGVSLLERMTQIVKDSRRVASSAEM